MVSTYTLSITATTGARDARWQISRTDYDSRTGKSFESSVVHRGRLPMAGGRPLIMMIRILEDLDADVD